MGSTNTVMNLEQLQHYFHRGMLIFTDDAEQRGIDNRLISTGLRLEMEMSRPSAEMWYLRRNGSDLVRYHPVTAQMIEFQDVAVEGLNTRIDFLDGSEPLIYDVCKAILDCPAGFRVAVPGLNGWLDELAVFQKNDNQYVRTKTILLRQ